MIKTKTILLTGERGYIGNAIAQSLRLTDCLLTAGRNTQDDFYIDLLTPSTITSLTLPENIDVLIHAAAAHEVVCYQKPIEAFTANVTATRALVEVAIKAKIKHIIYLSTFHVFGNPNGILDETQSPTPKNDYGLTHLLAEQVIELIAPQHGIKVTVLRPANVFGVPTNWATFNRWTLAPFDFIKQAHHNKKIILRNDGAIIRNYVSLSRITETVLEAMNGNLPSLVHLSGQDLSMHELAILSARVVESIISQPIEIILGNQPSLEAPYQFVSNHWAQEENVPAKMSDFFKEVYLTLKEEKYE